MRTVCRYRYAAYLVHWPVFVLARYVRLSTGVHADPTMFYATTTVTLAVAVKFSVKDRVHFAATRTCRILAACAVPTEAFYCTSCSEVHCNAKALQSVGKHRSAGARRCAAV